MKRKNFPGRKMIRIIEAEKRNSGTRHLPYTDQDLKRIEVAQGSKSKKRI